MQPQEFSEIALEHHVNTNDEVLGSQHAEDTPPLLICVASNDYVWADLLAQNLAARGATTIQCDLGNLKAQIKLLTDGSWIVVDGGWPMLELQGASEDLNDVLRQSKVRSVMVVDELVGAHPVSSFRPDKVVDRTPNMPVLARELLSIFNSPSSNQPEPAI